MGRFESEISDTFFDNWYGLLPIFIGPLIQSMYVFSCELPQRMHVACILFLVANILQIWNQILKKKRGKCQLNIEVADINAFCFVLLCSYSIFLLQTFKHSQAS